MQKEPEVYQSDFQSGAAKTSFRIVIIFLICGSLGANISIWVSTFSTERRVEAFFVINSAVAVFSLILFFIHRNIKSPVVRSRIYFVVIYLSYIWALNNTQEKFLVIVNILAGMIGLALTIQLEKKLLFIFYGTHLAVIVFYLIRHPEPVVLLSRGYYIFAIAAAVSMLLFSVGGVRLIRRYESTLNRHIGILNEQNAELMALNEEYLAAEETLQAQFDEIYSLHHQSELLIEKMEAIFDASADGIVDYDIQEEKYHFSDNALKILGFTHHSEDTRGMAENALKEEWMQEMMAAWRQMSREGKHSDNMEISYTSPSEDHQELRVSLVSYVSKIDRNEHLLAVVRDITHEKKQAQRVVHLAYHDQLTGLYNRLGFEMRINELIAKGHACFSVLVGDIRDFKAINSTFGYAVGNQILTDVANDIRFAPFDIQLSARLGSDDFAVVVEQCEETQTVADYFIAQRTSLGSDFSTMMISTNMGISQFPQHGHTAHELIQCAETAMYKSKERGPNQIAWFDQADNQNLQRTLMLAGAMERAMESDEFSMVFQPKIDTLTGDVFGFEALARWNSHKFGFVPPDVFIGIAEKNGTINRLSDIIIEKSCRFARAINTPTEERPKVISINISGATLMNEHFAEDFLAALFRHQVQSGWIGVEVTETAVVENITHASENLQRLRDEGIHVYLDDFGTGYSSLNYLSQLPVDILKIDKSFIRQLNHSPKGLRMVNSIMNLVRSFEIRAVAEGVESEEELTLLREMGCHMIQGYYFSKPLKEEDAVRFLETRHPGET